MSLFQSSLDVSQEAKPLPARLRPQCLDEIVGQASVIGTDTPLRKMIDQDQLRSVLFWGPPGCGKTALARVISMITNAEFVLLNAVMSNVSELRKVISDAKEYLKMGRKTIVFIDEIHRFNKAQQDALLPDVEEGTIVLIGATTENPHFSLNPSLLSRSQLFTLNALSAPDFEQLFQKVIAYEDFSFLSALSADCKSYLMRLASGDGRKFLSILEWMGVYCRESEGSASVDVETLIVADIQKQLQVSGVAHDVNSHYDLSSALIKSVRASDTDASLYWLARLIKGGEDPRFIARRLMILASEDIGNADPQALILASSALSVVSHIGLPEAQITLSQLTLYLVTAPKSNASYTAILDAMKVVTTEPLIEVPDTLKDTHYSGAKKLGYGDDYTYAHLENDGISTQSYLDKNYDFYNPKSIGFEKTIQKRLDYIKGKKKKTEFDA